MPAAKSLFPVLTPIDAKPGHVAALLQAGADPNERQDGLTPLLWLAKKHLTSAKLFDVLIAAGADVRATDAAGNTLLHLMAQNSLMQPSARILVKHGLAVDIKNKAGQTALHLAVQGAFGTGMMAVQFLLKAGADPSSKDAQGKTAIDLALGEYKDLLRKKPSPAGAASPKALLRAALAGDVAKLETLVRGGADVNGKGEGGRTALHAALAEGAKALPQVVQKLLALGAEPNAGDDFQRTPLFDLVQHSFRTDAYRDAPEIYDMLVKAGADPGRKDQHGNTPLVDLWNNTQYYRDIQDKKGFNRLMTHLLQSGAPATSGIVRMAKDWVKAKNK